MFKIHTSEIWRPDQIVIDWVESTRRIEPEVERHIERAWSEASARLGEKLFDGPMCRMERWSAAGGKLSLTLSRTSYRPFLGTNLTHPAFADQYGDGVLANPVGLSAALETADGWLLMGRRNDSVAYYPNRVHPFAGALEPADPLDIFAEVCRELREELSLTETDIAEICCIGLAEDLSIRQPELIFHVRSSRGRNEIESMLDRAEHIATYAVRASNLPVGDDPMFTPIAAATLALWRRSR